MDDITRPKPATTPEPTTSQPTPPSIAERMSIPISTDNASSPKPTSGPVDDIVKRTAPVVQPIHDDITPPSPEIKSLDDLDDPEVSHDTEANVDTPAKSNESTTSPILSDLDTPVSPSSTMPNFDAAIDPAVEEKNSDVPVEPTPAVEEPKPTATVMPASTDHPKAQKGRGIIILVAVLIALALVAGAAFAYWQNKKDTKTVTPAVITSTTPTKNPAKASDVEKTSSDIDTSLKKVDDTTDYQAADLSDTTLGL